MQKNSASQPETKRPADSQWPRFQVFVQEKTGAPHQDAGTVHATDAEMALLNARDVFVRRPACVSLWVTPAQEIYRRTAQQLAGEEPLSQNPSGEPEEYYIFCKRRSIGTQTLVGSETAASPSLALQAALQKDAEKHPAFAWWVVPARAITRSDPGDVESMFDPANDKPFRLSTDFHTVTAMREIKEKEVKGEAP